MTTPEFFQSEGESACEWIERLAGGFRAAQIILTANRLGLFEALGQQRLTTQELAAAMNASERGVRILCRALSAIGLLHEQDDAWRNSPAALETLIVDAPQSRTAILLHQAQLYECWGRLADCVRTGTGVEEDAIPPDLRLDETDFARAMADVGRAVSEEVAAALELSNTRTMLDLGGGPGLYAIALAKRNPHLRAVVYDTPETLRITRENIERAGLSDRVTTRPGDLFEDDYGGPYDFILLSNVVHIYSEEKNRQLVARCAEALTPGGRLCVKDFTLDCDGAGASWAALFAVNMLVNTEGGDCYSQAQIESWFRAAGLTPESARPIASNSQILIARKPNAV
jgi:3-hydroxy-5-methyl-1-naphthoate 3-O-methyltransferase